MNISDVFLEAFFINKSMIVGCCNLIVQRRVDPVFSFGTLPVFILFQGVLIHL